jgi:2-keto-4-pentenoate hydratase/2-oxohepta-3-ene-1,7-dioic acid hydratase in catechol pathway
VLRICKNGKYIAEHYAHKYYDAITVGIDFTARDIQTKLKEKGLPWERAKAWDNSAVIGKWIPIADIKDRKNVDFSFKKNGDTVQVGNSGQMIHSMDKIVCYISQFFSVNIGDLIFTGTPAGVGETVTGDALEGFLGEQSLLKLDVK